MLSRPESRLRIAGIIGSKLNISKEKVCITVEPKHQLMAQIDRKEENGEKKNLFDCLRAGPALLPDVSAWHHAERAGGLSGPSDSGSKAD